MAWYAVTDEVCLPNLTVLFFCQRASVTWITRPSRSVPRFYLFWWGMCILSFQTVPKQTFTPCYYFLSRGGSHREGGLANPSCTWLMGLLQGCTYLFYMSWNIFYNFAIKKMFVTWNLWLSKCRRILYSVDLCWLMTDASSSEIYTVFRQSNAGIVESNPAWSMYMSLMSEFLLCCPVLVGNCVVPKGYEKVSSDKIQRCLNSVNTWNILRWNLSENYLVSTADETHTWPAAGMWITDIMNIIMDRSTDVCIT